MNPWRGLGRLPKDVWILCSATFINRAGTMALPFLVLYLSKHLHYSLHDSGLVLTCYGLGALFTAPFSGRLSDRVGPIRIMRMSLLLSSFALLAFPFVRSWWHIVAATTLWSVVSEAFRPASLALISDLVPSEDRKAAFALNRLAINLGMSVGPALGGFLVVLSYDVLFWTNATTAFLAAILLMLAPWRVEAKMPARRKEEGDLAPSVARVRPQSPLRNGTLIYFLASIFPVLVIFFQHDSSMPLFLVRDLGLAESAYGLLFTVNTLLIVAIEVPLNLATAHRPHRQMLSLGALLVGAGFGAMAFSSGFFSVAATVVIWTWGEMILLPGAAAYMAEIAPPSRRGEYMGIFQMTFSLAFALSAFIGTAVLERSGATALWMGTFVAGCVSAGLFSQIGVRNSAERSKTT